MNTLLSWLAGAGLVVLVLAPAALVQGLLALVCTLGGLALLALGVLAWRLGRLLKS